MSKCVYGSVSEKFPLKDTVGQFFYCVHCQSQNVHCKGLSNLDNFMIILGHCHDCNKDTDFAITSSEPGKLNLTGDQDDEPDEESN